MTLQSILYLTDGGDPDVDITHIEVELYRADLAAVALMDGAEPFYILRERWFFAPHAEYHEQTRPAPYHSLPIPEGSTAERAALKEAIIAFYNGHQPDVNGFNETLAQQSLNSLTGLAAQVYRELMAEIEQEAEPS